MKFTGRIDRLVVEAHPNSITLGFIERSGITREEFEAWCVRRWRGDRGGLLRHPDGHPEAGKYHLGPVQFAWEAVEAATRASPAPVPDEQAGDAENLVTVDKRDLFDVVRSALMQASLIDDDLLAMVGREYDEAQAWADATNQAHECLSPLLAAAPSRPVAAEKREPLPEDLFVFLDACAGEGYVMSGVDAGDLCIRLFPERFPSLHGIVTHPSTGGAA